MEKKISVITSVFNGEKTIQDTILSVLNQDYINFELINIDPQLFNQGKSLLGCWGGNSHPDRDIEKFTEVIQAKKNILTTLFSTPYKLDDINEALNDLENGKIGRPIIDMAL